MKLTYIHTAIVGVMSLALHPSYLAAQPIAQLISNDGHEQIVIQNIPKPPPFIAPTRNEVKAENIYQVRKPLPVITEKTPVKHIAQYSPKQGGEKPKGIQNLPSQTKSLPPIRADLAAKAKSKPPLLKKLPPQSINASAEPSFYVSQGQTYMTAIRNWLTQNKLSRVAWSLPPATVAALSTPSSNGNLFKGDIESVIKQVGDKVGKPLYFSRNAKGMAAIHNIKGSVDILWINGATIKDAVKNLTLQYHWQWKNGDNSSWMAPDNYTLIAPYPVVAPRGDFAYALNTVLDGYPVQAQLLYATKNIFIVEKE